MLGPFSRKMPEILNGRAVTLGDFLGVVDIKRGALNRLMRARLKCIVVLSRRRRSERER